ncbi:MAG: hypothetical protein MPJ24_11550 [Pirellulaceae bacterium]|nr:hypothetical protein [Pirellulaceae bacterium]
MKRMNIRLVFTVLIFSSVTPIYGQDEVRPHFIFSENRNAFVRFESINDTSTFKILTYKYDEQSKKYSLVNKATHALRYEGIKFLGNNARYLVILNYGSGKCVSIYDLKTGKEKSFELSNFLSEEMIAGTKDEIGNRRSYGPNFPKVRTRISSYPHSHHYWTGDIQMG